MKKTRLTKLEAAISEAAEGLYEAASILGFRIDATFLKEAINASVMAYNSGDNFEVASVNEPIEHNSAADMIIAAHAMWEDGQTKSALRFVELAFDTEDMGALSDAMKEDNSQSAIGREVAAQLNEAEGYDIIASDDSEEEEQEEDDSEEEPSDEDSDDSEEEPEEDDSEEPTSDEDEEEEESESDGFPDVEDIETEPDDTTPGVTEEYDDIADRDPEALPEVGEESEDEDSEESDDSEEESSEEESDEESDDSEEDEEPEDEDNNEETSSDDNEVEIKVNSPIKGKPVDTAVIASLAKVRALRNLVSLSGTDTARLAAKKVGKKA